MLIKSRSPDTLSGTFTQAWLFRGLTLRENSLHEDSHRAWKYLFVQRFSVCRGVVSPLGESMPPTTLNPRPFLTPGPFSNSTLCTVTPEKPWHGISFSSLVIKPPAGASGESLSPSLLEAAKVCFGAEPQLQQVLLSLQHSWPGPQAWVRHDLQSATSSPCHWPCCFSSVSRPPFPLWRGRGPPPSPGPPPRSWSPSWSGLLLQQLLGLSSPSPSDTCQFEDFDVLMLTLTTLL